MEQYLEKALDRKHSKATDSLVESIFHYAMTTNQAVTRNLVDDYIRYEIKNREQFKWFNDKEELKLKSYEPYKFDYIATQKPVHPLPNMDDYDPEDYTGIKQERETINKNKGINLSIIYIILDYSIPNVCLEGDSEAYPSSYKINTRFKPSNRSRARPLPNKDRIFRYVFSSQVRPMKELPEFENEGLYIS